MQMMHAVLDRTFCCGDLVADVADHEQLALGVVIQHVGMHARIGAGHDCRRRILAFCQCREELDLVPGVIADVFRFELVDKADGARAFGFVTIRSLRWA
jgi:hypothetical protein